MQLKVQELHKTGNFHKVFDSDDCKIKSTKGSYVEIAVFWITRRFNNLV